MIVNLSVLFPKSKTISMPKHCVIEFDIIFIYAVSDAFGTLIAIKT